MKVVKVTQLLYAMGAVVGTTLVKFQRGFDLNADQVHFEAKSSPRAKRLFMGFPTLKIGVEMQIHKGQWKTALVHVIPLDKQPMEYALVVVKGVMILNEIARLTDGREIAVESLGLESSVSESIIQKIKEGDKAE